ncbi:anaerobic C4-dicarboxylate transporter family protein [Candidatus Tachikawaea gelatinosa]|uniref:C4-dicarboxylate transporter n=1 Tax=Candidatus Tachikawaea gelatinosa TaxID=1410383 RepID=A0A090AMJ3_9ENTR|nr:anaerobic C4-dicarboxylate transporter family protein [Candidatus Tachikawaea gelatinosa]BAP58814.1 anaerobic c4-dicarboxylate antiporter Dcu family [Candidatus Tachikawaea gelatinosa]
MIIVELLIVFLSIGLGIKLGGIGIGFSGGLGVFLLTFFCKAHIGSIPFDVIGIIISVISATSTLEAAGGTNYLIDISERFLRKRPKYINFLAPLVTYLITIVSGTGNMAFATLPIISELAKKQGVQPSRPLSASVVASQIAITASPLSAAVILFSSLLEETGINYLKFLGISFFSTIAGIFFAILTINFFEDNFFQKKYHKNIIIDKKKVSTSKKIFNKKQSRTSVLIFLIGVIFIVVYSFFFEKNATFGNLTLSRNNVSILVMLTIATLITLYSKLDSKKILKTNIFTIGMSACVCIMGVSLLGDTFLHSHFSLIQNSLNSILKNYPWMLSIILFFSSIFLYSQAVTTKIFMPLMLALGIKPIIIISSFSAVSALFVLPTYPTLLAAIEIDDTGSTYIGKYIFNHSFIIPGILSIFFSVLFSFIMCLVIL